eukprot:6223411-Amphidinium_carterae.1
MGSPQAEESSATHHCYVVSPCANLVLCLGGSRSRSCCRPDSAKHRRSKPGAAEEERPHLLALRVWQETHEIGAYSFGDDLEFTVYAGGQALPDAVLGR